jgi:hypothetical protein
MPATIVIAIPSRATVKTKLEIMTSIRVTPDSEDV